MRYTVRQLAKLAGVTTRTLHYYDEIGLLHPQTYGDNGYRYYGEDDLLRLQQILFYRELDFSLAQIKTIIDRSDFDLVCALEGHKAALLDRVERITSLIHTVDQTILHIRGEIVMAKKDFYKGFDEAKQKKHAEEAQRRWGDTAAQSQKRWDNSTPETKNEILGEMHAIGEGVAANMDKGHDSPEVQHWIARWHKAINIHFYECSLEIFESLGHMYVQDPEFTATYEKIRPGMAVFMEKAMVHYCRAVASK
jgi:MerR family transcriptional regulator, thiopeptide resistance regulator